MIEMTHPNLSATVKVPARSVPGMKNSGWTEATPSPPATDWKFVPGSVLTADQLLEKAAELGITVDGRWGVDRLRSEIFDALASPDAGTTPPAADGDHNSPKEN